MEEIRHKHGLINDFREVAARFKSQLPDFFQAVAGPHIPFADIDVWKRVTQQNCYNYARNTASGKRLQPGDLASRQRALSANDNAGIPSIGQTVFSHPLLSREPGFFTPRIYGYSQDILRRLAADGDVTWAGFDLSTSLTKKSELQRGWSTALFFKTQDSGGFDYHWYTVRGRNPSEAERAPYGFAEKKGRLPARWVPANDIFGDASQEGYGHFAGFFHFDPVTG